MALVERFLRYVSFDTQSSEETRLTPSTPGQMVFAKYLKTELERKVLVASSISVGPKENVSDECFLVDPEELLDVDACSYMERCLLIHCLSLVLF